MNFEATILFLFEQENFELLLSFGAQMLDAFIPCTERGQPLCLLALDGPY